MSLNRPKTLFSAIAGCLTFSLLLPSGDTNAQTRSETIRPIEFLETYDPAPVVSGPSLFMALYDTSSEPGRFENGIAVTVGASGYGKICLKGFSRDKKYAVNASYDIDAIGEGYYALEFPTKHEAILSEYGEYDLALSIWFAEDCGSRIGEIELMPYNSGKRADFSLLIQSKGAESTLSNESADTVSTCQPIADTPAVRWIAYDKICRVEGGSDDIFRVETRDIFEEPLASQLFKIVSGQ